MDIFRFVKAQQELLRTSFLMVYNLYVSDAILNDTSSEQDKVIIACFKLAGLKGDPEIMDIYSVARRVADYVEETGLHK